MVNQLIIQLQPAPQCASLCHSTLSRSLVIAQNVLVLFLQCTDAPACFSYHCGDSGGIETPHHCRSSRRTDTDFNSVWLTHTASLVNSIQFRGKKTMIRKHKPPFTKCSVFFLGNTTWEHCQQLQFVHIVFTRRFVDYATASAKEWCHRQQQFQQGAPLCVHNSRIV